MPAPRGTEAVWPITAIGDEGRWRTGIDVAKRRWNKGLLRAEKSLRGRKWSIITVDQGVEDSIHNHELKILGYKDDGSAIIDTSNRSMMRDAKTTWNKISHNACWHGTKLVAGMLFIRFLQKKFHMLNWDVISPIFKFSKEVRTAFTLQMR